MIKATIELHKPLLGINPIDMLFSDRKVFDQWVIELKNSDYIKKVVSVIEVKDI